MKFVGILVNAPGSERNTRCEANSIDSIKIWADGMVDRYPEAEAVINETVLVPRWTIKHEARLA
jgi:hypothetical protein